MTNDRLTLLTLSLFLALLIFATKAAEARTIYVDRDTQRLTVVHEGEVELESKVIVGRPDRPTPAFTDTLNFIVTSPFWNVPSSLRVKDVIPKFRRNPNYFHSGRYQVLDSRGNDVSQTFLDSGFRWSKGWRLRQRPGPNNALGTVKFMLNDRMRFGPAVFMHDTNHPELFDNPDGSRRFSSGCIRVEKAAELMHLLGVPSLTSKETWHKVEMTTVVVR